MTINLYKKAENAYGLILDGIYRSFKIKGEHLKIGFLKELRTDSRRLWESYQTQNVHVDYSSHKIQAAYLLRYFVPYTLPINSVLIESGYSFKKQHVEACFVGAGPAPEALGLMSFLQTHNNNVQSAVVHLYDRTENEWDFSRNISCGVDMVTGIAPRLSVDWKSHALDFANTKPAARKIDLLVFQNCLNEVLPARFDLKQLKKWVENVIPGGAIIVIDRSGYPAVADFLTNAALTLEAEGFNFLMKEIDRTVDTKPCSRVMPKAVLENLLHCPQTPWPATESPYGLRLASDVKYMAYMFVKPL